jgi:hypothetical protein
MLYRTHPLSAVRLLMRSRVMVAGTAAFSTGGSKGLNMTILPGNAEGYSVPDEAKLTGWALVSRRAANMVFTVYGEKPMTKVLQLGGDTGFIDALGNVSAVTR